VDLAGTLAPECLVHDVPLRILAVLICLFYFQGNARIVDWFGLVHYSRICQGA